MIANEIKNVGVGEFGKPIILTMQDDDATAQNISSYTTRTIKFRSPSKRKTVTQTATFVTDGTDGKLTFSFSDGDLNQSGKWEGMVILLKTGVEVHSELIEMIIEKEVG